MTFAYVPASDDSALGLVHDHAYWVSEVTLADDMAGDPPKGVLDAFSHGFGVGDPPSTAGADAGTAGAFTYTEVNRSWGTAPPIPVENLLDVTLQNLGSARLDLARAALDPSEELRLATDADVASLLSLDGAFPACSQVLEDDTLLPGVSAGPSGAVVPIAAGTHTYQITCTGAFQLRRVFLLRVGAGLDRLLLNGRLAATIAALGLPGSSLTVSLRDAGGTFFTATVPGALLVPNKNGTRLRFRDPSGTLAGGITHLRIGGRRRTDLGLRARNLNLAGAGPGDFTAQLVIGTRTLESSGTLRAQSTRLLYP